MKKIIFLIIILLSLPNYGCFPIALTKNGIVKDKYSGLPLKDVVLIRSWSKVYASPAGAVSRPLDFQEKLSDENGKFKFPAKFLAFLGVPIFTWTEQHDLIAFKPGYKFLSVDANASILEMEKISSTYYMRYEEVQKAQGNYEVDFYTTKLFKAVIEKEEEAVKLLPRYVPGVFYQGFSFEKEYLISPEDIDINRDDNIYIADGGFPRMIQKISPDSEKIRKNTLYIRGGGSGGQIDIDRDSEGYLYAFAKGVLMRIDENNLYPIPIIPESSTSEVFPDWDMHFTIDKNKKIFLITVIKPISQKPVLYSYNLDGTLLCKYEANDSKKDPLEIEIQLIDLTVDGDGNILVGYSYFNPSWNSDTKSYQYRNGILKLNQNCTQMFDTKLNLDGKMQSLTTTRDGGIIIADQQRFYIYDKSMNLLYKYNLGGRELGEIQIKRIKADIQGEYLFLIESKYRRILAYNLNTKELFNKKGLFNRSHITK